MHGNRSHPQPMEDDLAPPQEPVRIESRRSERYTVPEPHERFELYPEEVPSGMDPTWQPISIMGQPNEKLAQFYRAGWQPAAAKDFPRVSGYGVEYPQAMIDAGLLRNVEANAPVLLDNQILLLRPKELSVRAERRRNRDAVDQVTTQMNRLSQAYRSARGVGVQRRHAPMPDMAPARDEEY